MTLITLRSEKVTDVFLADLFWNEYGNVIITLILQYSSQNFFLFFLFKIGMLARHVKLPRTSKESDVSTVTPPTLNVLKTTVVEGLLLQYGKDRPKSVYNVYSPHLNVGAASKPQCLDD